MHPTFKEMMNEVVAYGSCCECGTCVLVCPHNVIDYVDGKPKQVAKASNPFDYCGISEGIGCDVCAQVCPRLGEREHRLADAVFGDDQPFRGGFGVYRRVVAARSTDPAVLARCEDGGVVTTLLAWGLRTGTFDGAVVSRVEDADPCRPQPRVVTTAEDAIASASSWYTYCPNDLALADAERQGLTRVAFVGVPCQITPLRKMQVTDPAYLDNGRKKPKHVERQRYFLKNFGDRVALAIGLLCSEVFTFDELMVDTIAGRMGIPLASIRKFNVKGKVLIDLKNGERVELPLREAQEFARPECHHCGDFSAELADISCGGVGATDWTITVLRTARGAAIFDQVVRDGLLDVRPIEEFETSMKVFLRLARKQRVRVPLPPGRSEAWVRPPGFAA